MQTQRLIVMALNAIKADALDKMNSILAADYVHADKDKLTIRLQENTYLIYFKKSKISIKNQRKAGDFSFPHITKVKEQQLIALWQQVQALGYSAAKIHGLRPEVFSQICLKPDQQEIADF